MFYIFSLFGFSYSSVENLAIPSSNKYIVNGSQLVTNTYIRKSNLWLSIRNGSSRYSYIITFS